MQDPHLLFYQVVTFCKVKQLPALNSSKQQLRESPAASLQHHLQLAQEETVELCGRNLYLYGYPEI